jgi:hypothetical protein
MKRIKALRELSALKLLFAFLMGLICLSLSPNLKAEESLKKGDHVYSKGLRRVGRIHHVGIWQSEVYLDDGIGPSFFVNEMNGDLVQSISHLGELQAGMAVMITSLDKSVVGVVTDIFDSSRNQDGSFNDPFAMVYSGGNTQTPYYAKELSTNVELKYLTRASELYAFVSRGAELEIKKIAEEIPQIGSRVLFNMNGSGNERFGTVVKGKLDFLSRSNFLGNPVSVRFDDNPSQVERISSVGLAREVPVVNGIRVGDPIASRNMTSQPNAERYDFGIGKEVGSLSVREIFKSPGNGMSYFLAIDERGEQHLIPSDNVKPRASELKNYAEIIRDKNPGGAQVIRFVGQNACRVLFQ